MSLRRQNTLARQRGFSLVELVIVIVLLGIISAVGSQLLASAFRGYFLGRDLAEADWQGRLGLARMSREIRDIPTPADLTTMNPAQIGFNDINASAITYTLVGTSLQRNGTVLADDVTSLSFTYLDAALATTAVATEVRHIAIGLTVSRGGGSMALRTTVTNRNLQ